MSIDANTTRSRISYQKARWVSPAEIAATTNDSKIQEHHEFAKVYQEYEVTLAGSNLLDFDDLLLRCGDLLSRHPTCVSNVQAVLVDEFQDTNHIQYELMNLFASKNKRITVVGDPDQSIYGFRAAEIKNLTRMQQLYKNTSIVLLEENYRSSGSILGSAQDVIEQDVSRPAKKLLPTHCAGTLPVLRKLPNVASEAEWLVLEIRRCTAMTGGLLKYSDFAVLLRSASLSRQIEAELAKARVPYRMVGGFRFFDRVEIKLLVDYLRVVSNPGNSDALLRIINTPPRSIGEASVGQLVGGAEAAKMTVWDFVNGVAQGRKSTKKSLHKSTDLGLRNFISLIEACREKLLECQDGSPARVLLQFITEKLSFQDYLTFAYPLDDYSRWANVEELLCQAGESVVLDDAAAEESEGLPEIEGLIQQQTHPSEEALARFLANVSLSTEPTQGESEQETMGRVTISTIHAAKGLEWPIVFVPSVYEGILPHSRAEDSDEERRLLYVAMTRAQASLYLSYPLRQPSRGGTVLEETIPTSFLPSKVVDRCFRLAGADFQDNVVHDMAKILQRPAPSAENMIKGLERTPRVRDDKWTLEGIRQTDEIEAFSSSAGDKLPDPKRRRFDTGPTKTTYMSSSGYTMGNRNGNGLMAPTTLPSGFSTAREYVKVNPSSLTPEAIAEDFNHKQRAKALGTAPGPKTTGPSQGSLPQFFGGAQGKPGAAPSVTSNSYTQPHSQGNTKLAQQGQYYHKPSHTDTVPAHLLEHRVRPAASAAVGSRPALSPSDPNKYAWLNNGNTTSHLSSSSEAKPTNYQKESVQNGNEKLQDATNQGTKKQDADRGDTAAGKRMTTFHNTTTSMMRGQGGNNGVKKEKPFFGVRRSSRNVGKKTWMERERENLR